MDNETMYEYIRVSDRMGDIACELQLMRTLMTGMLDVFESECLSALRFIPADSCDLKKSFTALASSLYCLYDKINELCYPETT